jgi:hypothetical protein
MKVYGGVDVQIYVFFTSALVEAMWSDSRPCCFSPRTQWKLGCVDPIAGLDDMKWKFLTLLRLELRTLGRPARRQSPYWPRYRADTVI